MMDAIKELTQLYKLFIMALWVAVFALTLIVTTALNPAYALRCKDTSGNNYLVYKGDWEHQVISKCGTPIYKDEQIGGIQSDVSIMVYDDGNGMKETLIFRMGRLESTEFQRQ